MQSASQTPQLYFKAGTHYTTQQTPLGTFSVPVTAPPEPPAHHLNGLHKIPIAAYQQMLGFLLWTQEEFQAEGLIYAFHHPELGWYVMPPEQTTRGMTVSADDTALEARLAPDGWTLRFTAHHHCTTNAFQSGTDKTDEHSKPSGIHITLGELNKPSLSYHGRIIVRLGQTTHQFDINLQEFGKLIDFGDLPPMFANKLELIYPILLMQTTASEFPEEWKALIKRPKPVSPTHHMATGTTAINTYSNTTANIQKHLIEVSVGPVDNHYRLEDLLAITSSKSAAYYIPLLADPDLVKSPYNWRILMTFLCSAYPFDDVIDAFYFYTGKHIHFKSPGVLDMYNLLQQYADVPYDVTGNTVAFLDDSKLKEFADAKFDTKVMSFQRNNSNPAFTAMLSKMASYVNENIAKPVDTNECVIRIRAFPPCVWFPEALIDYFRQMEITDLAHVLKNSPHELIPYMLILACDSTQHGSLLSELEKLGVVILFAKPAVSLSWDCILSGYANACCIRNKTIFTDTRSHATTVAQFLSCSKNLFKVNLVDNVVSMLPIIKGKLYNGIVDLLLNCGVLRSTSKQAFELLTDHISDVADQVIDSAEPVAQ